MERTTVYFEGLGPENTDATLALVCRRAEELGVKKIILASTTGATARTALELFTGGGSGLSSSRTSTVSGKGRTRFRGN